MLEPPSCSAAVSDGPSTPCASRSSLSRTSNLGAGLAGGGPAGEHAQGSVTWLSGRGAEHGQGEARVGRQERGLEAEGQLPDDGWRSRLTPVRCRRTSWAAQRVRNSSLRVHGLVEHGRPERLPESVSGKDVAAAVA
jgi:hypothetical protein